MRDRPLFTWMTFVIYFVVGCLTFGTLPRIITSIRRFRAAIR